MSDKESQWTRIIEGHLHGVIDQELRSVLAVGFFEDLDYETLVRGGRVLKDTRVRWVAKLPVKGGKGLLIKRFRIAGGWQGFKYLIRPSQAAKEWRISRFLTRKGIPTPRALGALETRRHGILKDCYFITEAVDGATDLIDFCKNRFHRRDRRGEQDRVLRPLAETTRKIHDSGLFHRDFHAGNFLVTDEGSLYLVDLHQARKQVRVSPARRLWNIAQILNSLDFMLDREAKKLFLLTYGHGEAPFGRNLERCLDRVEQMSLKMVKRRQKSRAKRCLKESSLFTNNRRAGFRVFRRKEMEEDDVMAILETHAETVRSHRERLLKDSPKTMVSMVNEAGPNRRKVCVKEYRYPALLDRLRHLFRQPKGKVSWVEGNLLFSRGIYPLKPLAYAERRRLGLLQAAFYVTESVAQDMEMDRYLIRTFQGPARSDLRRFVQRFSGWLGTLHREGIYHRDLKTCNILVREIAGGWEFSLIDLEDVVHGTSIGMGRILRNLVQINCSVPKSFSYGDRIRFLKGYLRANPVSIDERALIRRVLEETRRRGIVYVSPQGDVFEEFE